MDTIPAAVVILSRATGTPNLRRLVAALAAHGLDASVQAPGADRRPLRADGAPVVGFTRLPSGTPPGELADLPAAGAPDGPTAWVNAPHRLPAVHDKAAALARLRDAGLPVPETCVVLRDGGDELDDLPGERFVVKPPTGLAGRGVVTGLDRASARARGRAYADLCGRALVQRERGDGIDRRILLVDGQPVAGMLRRPAAGDGRGSTLYGARAESWQPDAACMALARDAASAFRLDVAGVDLLLEPSGPLVLEVNSCPGFEALEAATGADVAGALAALCARRARAV